jgi:autotransporter-associated beta strand protein
MSQSLTAPGQSQQFNRVGYVMTVAEVYTSAAAANLGGAADLEVDMNNALAGANVVMQNSGTGLWVVNVGYYEATETDPGTLHALLGQFWTWPDVAAFWSSTGAGIIQCVGDASDDAGLSYECGAESTVSSVYGAWDVVYAHELGRCCCLEQGDDVGVPNPFYCIMLQGYCGGASILYCSNPSVYYDGIQLLGTTNDDCGEGPLANEGNNSRQFALNGPNYQGSIKVAFTNFNPLLTAVHCGGSAVATLSPDQRTFAADQNYSGGSAWDANGYTYAVDVGGVTNPAPQTAYQDQRYGNMTYAFTGFLPGANYLVRLHCVECCWVAAGQRVFNVFINGHEVLTNFDIFATAGAQNKAVIKEIMTQASTSGSIAIQFVNVTDNACISAIEILQGGLYVPVNLTAAAGNARVTLNWSPVAGAASYNVKRGSTSGGPYTNIANTTSASYNDNPLSGATTYYYVVSAVNGVNESFDSLEAGVTTPVTVNSDTWLGGTGNNFSTATNWIYAIGSGPVSNSDALVFGSAGSTTPNNDESGFGFSTITYNAGAQSFTIGGNPFSLGTNTVSGQFTITVNSANPQIINNNITLVAATPVISTAGGNLTLGGGVSATNLVTKTGAGTLNLAGTGGTLSAGLAVGAGRVNVAPSGTLTSGGAVTVGNAANNAVLDVPSGHLTGLNFNVGTVSGAAGAVYQTGGTVAATQAAGQTDFQIGNAAGAYGCYSAGGGNLSVNEIGVAGEISPGNGLMEINGGAVSDSGWVVVSRSGAAQIGVLNLFSGTITYAGGGEVNCWGAGQTAVVNIMGGSIANTLATVGFNLNWSGSSANTSILNLNGGSAQASGVIGAYSRLNFNGGTLKASEAGAAFISGLAAVNIYGGGATINNNGYVIAIGQPLLAPAGNGVNSIASFTGGAGYIAPPIVTVLPGAGDTTGIGATAIAQINPQAGVVTNVIITCPGVNYTATPAFILTGGGPAAAATITGAAPTPNTSGGLTLTGTGVVTLAAHENYGGNTTISGGTLRLSSAPVLYMSFNDVSGSTVINQGAGGAAMNGTLTGAATIVSGGIHGGNALSIPSGAANAACVRINNPVVAMTGAAGWSIGMWVKTTTAGGVYAYQGSGGWVSGNMTFYLNEGSDSGPGTKAGGVSWGQGWEEGTTTVNDGNWHFLVMTCNGSTKAMYVDGKVDAIVSSWSPATGVGSQFWIGGSADAGDQDVGLGGLIDDVYVYDYALSQAQVQSLYSNTPVAPPVLPASTAVTVASGATLDVGGITQTIASLTGSGGSSVILADATTATGTLTVGNASNTLFAGAINGAGSLAKVGTGTLTLSGANTYPGNTVVSNGTLALSGAGSIASSATINVNSGATFDVSAASSYVLGAAQTLLGNGAVNGAVTVNGTVAPGASTASIGTLTFNTAPALDGTLLMKINRANAQRADLLSLASGPLTCGGALTVINIGGPPQAGDTFTLFSAAGYTNAFISTNLPSLASGLAWNVASLNNGLLSVVSTEPVDITAWISKGALNLSWPADHTGWLLQAQTNGLANGWFNVPGSSLTNSLAIPVVVRNDCVFYRLIWR